MIFEIDCIGVAYGTRRVLTSASLRAAAGAITVLVGRNGSGKTSILRAGVGLMRFTHGIVRLDGATHVRPSLARLARAGLFYLPDRDVLEPSIPLGAQLRAVRDRFQGPAVEGVAERLWVTERLAAPPASLSGGERRRAEVALAMVRDPRCLVADEPFRGLAPRDAEVVAEALRGLAEQGVAVVVSGHELSTLQGLADAVVWCVAGTTHEFPDARQAWSDPQLQRDFLGYRSAAQQPERTA